MTTRLDTTLRHLWRSVEQNRLRTYTDAQLLLQFRKERDDLAFEEIIRRHGPMVLAICRRTLGASPDVDDAFQAIFLVFVRKANSIRHTTLLANWLCGVAYRVTRKTLHQRLKLRAREQNMEPFPERGYEPDAPNDWLPFFDAVLRRLPDKYRLPVVLCDLQGQSRLQAAKQLGLSENTLSSRLARAREMLRAKLNRFGFPLSFSAAIAPMAIPQTLLAATLQSARMIDCSVAISTLAEGVVTSMFFSKLKTGVACMILLVAAGLFSSQLGSFNQADAQTQGNNKEPAKQLVPDLVKETPKPAPQPERAKADIKAEDELSGTWKVVGVERSGFDITDEMLEQNGEKIPKELLFQFAGPSTGKMQWGAKPEPLQFTVDRSKSPTEVSFGPPNPALGIYQVEGNVLLLCVSPQKDRPKVFRTDPGSEETLFRCERVKKSKEQTTDKQKFQGSWQVASALRDGIDYRDKLNGSQWQFTEKSLHITLNGNHFTVRWLINPKVPQRLIKFRNYFLSQQKDLVWMDCIGIYEFEKDRIRIAFRPIEGRTKPPTTFNGDNGDGSGVMILERIAEPKQPLMAPASTDDLLSPPKLDGRRSTPKPVEPKSPPPGSFDSPRPGPNPEQILPPRAVPGTPQPTPTVPMVFQDATLPEPKDPQPAATPPVLGSDDDLRPPSPALGPSAIAIATSYPIAAKEVKKPDDLALMQGKWSWVEEGGKKIEGGRAVEIVRDVMLGEDGRAERFHIDPSTAPKRIDLTLIMGKNETPTTQYGIYKIEGNQLYLCLQKVKSPRLRPTEFVNDTDAEIELIVLQRPAPEDEKKPGTGTTPLLPKADRAPADEDPTAKRSLALGQLDIHLPLVPVAVPYRIAANVQKIRAVGLYVSGDRGKSWKLVIKDATAAQLGQFKFTPGEPGLHWFAVGIFPEDGTSPKLSELTPALKVIFDATPTPSGVIVPKTSSENEKLRDEVRELRKRLEELEKNLGTKK